ncbi:aminotransferase class III-fold pyridoxal phosphate-dependent enzyme [Candidatus Aminicenantes bacterium AH-873-B07]|jgi:glutamate-1-semialdehyde 2,1-aminomutase|nr:aminotransferase class III-fold pyridoxal phosphate-dependent enzyme [Candidatus Aminicenantes bacterium AH-873-B07]
MNKKVLMDELIKNYKIKHKKSEEIFKEASGYLINGGSHNLRLFEPFPFYDIECKGSKVIDIDGNVYIDFWQGHFANVLGHNPDIIIEALSDYFKKGQGLQTGFPSLYQKELAKLILKQIKVEKIRFTTSGTLSTMYAIMLAKAYTQRDLILKVFGGWHGAQPYVLKGITTYGRNLNKIESAGLPSDIDSQILVTKFNDPDDLKEKFNEFGERIACFIVEPFVGAGGFIFAHKEYLNKARELTKKYGALLIFDEVVSGFRFHASAIYNLYGIKPDLCVFGKTIGGGMPVSAVAGREDVLDLCSAGGEPEKKVKFSGGTFSAHPASMLAGLTYINYLIENEDKIYPKIGKLGEKARKEIEAIFENYGLNVKCTGYGNSIVKYSSCVGVHFLNEEIEKITTPEEVWNPKVCDVELREKIFKLAMVNEGFNIFHGFGAISFAHTEEEIQASLDAIERIAQKWSKLK